MVTIAEEEAASPRSASKLDQSLDISLDLSSLGLLLQDVNAMLPEGEKKWNKQLNEDKDLVLAKECVATGVSLPDWLAVSKPDEQFRPTISHTLTPRKNFIGVAKKPLVTYLVRVGDQEVSCAWSARLKVACIWEVL